MGKSEVNPVVFWVAVAVVVVGVAGFFILHTRSSSGPGESNGEESKKLQQQYQQKGTLINMPPGMAAPGARPGMPNGGMNTPPGMGRPGMPGGMSTPPGVAPPPNFGSGR